MPSTHKRSSGKDHNVQTSVQQLIETLETHRINTATELCRIERVAPTISNAEEARAFQGPMTAAWTYYVETNFLTELRGLTPSYPFSAAVLKEAKIRVATDPRSNRSWNMAWLCLSKIVDDKLVSHFAKTEALMPEMWGGRPPTPEEAEKLGACFEAEWNSAITKMLRLWTGAPAWY